MNKINVLFLSGLVLVGANAYGMNAQNQANRSWLDAFINAIGFARNQVRQDFQNAPVVGVAAQANQARQKMRTAKEGIRDFKKDTKGIVGEVFEIAEEVASAGFGFERYNSYIHTLDDIQEAMELNQNNPDINPIILTFNADDFSDLVNAEKEALKKQKTTPVVRQVVNRNRRQPAQQRVVQNPVGQVANLVTTLEQNIEAYNRVIDAQVRAANLQQRGQGIRAGGANNVHNTLVNAKNTLDKTIDSLRSKIEQKRDAACRNSAAGEFVYGGAGLRSWLTMGALALGALYFGQAMKNEPVVQENVNWISGMFTNAFNWIAAKFA